MTEKEEKILILVAAVFLVCALITMGYVIKCGTGVVPVSDEQPELSESENVAEAYFESTESTEADIIIDLQGQDETAQYQIEENLKEQTIEIVIQDIDEDYYYQHKIEGNVYKILQVAYHQNKRESTLKFALQNVYMADTWIQDGRLYIKLENPMEKYDRIVVLEGGAWTQEELDTLESAGIKGLVTGDATTANALRADALISLSTEGVKDEEPIYIYYNDDYFIPSFNSRNLADELMEVLADSYGEKQVVLVKSEEEELVDAMVPAVLVSCSKLKETEVENLIINVLLEQYQEMEEKE
jgi:hypothetical protein